MKKLGFFVLIIAIMAGCHEGLEGVLNYIIRNKSSYDIEIRAFIQKKIEVDKIFLKKGAKFCKRVKVLDEEKGLFKSDNRFIDSVVIIFNNEKIIKQAGYDKNKSETYKAELNNLIRMENQDTNNVYARWLPFKKQVLLDPRTVIFTDADYDKAEVIKK